MANSMTEPCGGHRVWATRPEQQNRDWAASLRQHFDVVELPLLSIEPVSEVEAVQAVKNLILDFDQFQKVIFVSQNAVQETFEWLDDYWPQRPDGVEYFAIGEKTAKAVRAHQVDAVSGNTVMNSEELLSLSQLQEVWGQRILICRGHGGLPKIGEVLHERGAVVRYCELYLRRLPAEAPGGIQQAIANHDQFSKDIVPLFSGETLENLNLLLGNHHEFSKSAISLVVPGKRVNQLALSLGYPNVYMAANASAEEMLRVVHTVAQA